MVLKCGVVQICGVVQTVRYDAMQTVRCGVVQKCGVVQICDAMQTVRCGVV